MGWRGAKPSEKLGPVPIFGVLSSQMIGIAGFSSVKSHTLRMAMRDGEVSDFKGFEMGAPNLGTGPRTLRRLGARC